MEQKNKGVDGIELFEVNDLLDLEFNLLIKPLISPFLFDVVDELVRGHGRVVDFQELDHGFDGLLVEGVDDFFGVNGLPGT